MRDKVLNKIGLIGKKLGHSFSKKYFDEKFEREGLDNWNFELYELDYITELERLVKTKQLLGLSVTIPYKLEIMQFCNKLDGAAKNIGAVNCLKINGNNYTGYNTDWIGFRNSLDHTILDKSKKALICGTGGASRAIVYALKELGIEIIQVSSSGVSNCIGYEDLDQSIMDQVHLIINCTHLGTFPNMDECISIPYDLINKGHYCYDLVYNPEETLFLRKARQQGAKFQNGYEMLVKQAEAAWEIWRNDE